MPYVRTDRNGVTTFERPGTGTPLVILPGVMADAKNWMPVADAIDCPNPVVIINRRGRAPSRGLGAGYGVPVEITDLADVVAVLGEPVHLFGWSYGGLIALEAAATGLPIRSLVVYEPVSRPFAPEAVEPIRDALARGDAGRAVEIVNRDVSGFDHAHVETLRASPVWPDLCRLALPLASELTAIEQFDPAYARYGSIDRPITLILGASNQGKAPYGVAFERFERALPQASVDILLEEGHLAHVNDPTTLGCRIATTVF